MQARIVAVRVLMDVSNGVSLSRALPVWQNKLDVDKDQALLQELSYGVLRWYPRLNSLLPRLLQKPLKSKDQDIHCLLLLGLYQLIYTRIPNHAAVAETVNVTRQLKKKWAGSLVNAVLRSFLRNKEQLLAELDSSESADYAHPEWMIRLTKDAWPESWQSILEANNQRPPMTLRVNQKVISVQEYAKLLVAKGITSQSCRYSPNGLTLDEPRPVDMLPNFHQGMVSVQDQAAQLAAHCLNVAPGDRVLDICAAPGGKTGHILELQPELQQLVAVDNDPERLQRIEENLQRLGLQASVMLGDASAPQSWWDGKVFDRILLDAPCTGSGVIRRHPDAKILKKESDIEKITQLQAQILDAVWPLLRPGGMLLYATCSIWPQENTLQIKSFLARMENASHLPLAYEWGEPQLYGRQILTGEDRMDGFYYACLVKQ